MSEEMCANYKREEWKCNIWWNSLITQYVYMHRFNELLSELDFGILSCKWWKYVLFNSRWESFLLDMEHLANGSALLLSCGMRTLLIVQIKCTFQHGGVDPRGRKEWCVPTPSFLNAFGPYKSAEVSEHTHVPTLILMKTYTCWNMSFSLCILVRCGEHWYQSDYCVYMHFSCLVMVKLRQ